MIVFGPRTPACDPCAEGARCELCRHPLCETGPVPPAPGCGTRCDDCPSCSCHLCDEARWDIEIDRRFLIEREGRAS